MAHDVDMSLSGTVRVANISFHKSVCLRYTLDKWRTTEPDVSLAHIVLYCFVYKFLIWPLA